MAKKHFWVFGSVFWASVEMQFLEMSWFARNDCGWWCRHTPNNDNIVGGCFHLPFWDMRWCSSYTHGNNWNKTEKPPKDALDKTENWYCLFTLESSVCWVHKRDLILPFLQKISSPRISWNSLTLIFFDKKVLTKDFTRCQNLRPFPSQVQSRRCCHTWDPN